MANRSTTNTASSTGVQYAAPGTYANAQTDILLSQLATSITLTTNQGTSGAFQSPAIPIQTITEVSTTATIYTGSPMPNYITTSTTAKISGTGTGYDGSYTVVSNVDPYHLTITATSGLGTIYGGVLTFSGTIAAASSTTPIFTPAGAPYRPAVKGSTINGNVVGVLEQWADKAIWDESNSVYYAPGIQFPSPV